jgi:arsenite methyltransferase
VTSDDPSLGLPRTERIILYIDDLDRCAADRVVQVLEAVHLLLAIPLFVVVVGVDARWLLRSLEHHYAALMKPQNDNLTDPGEAAHWAATPMNYLEKIFRIPYSLRPMAPAGYGRLIEASMLVRDPTEQTRQESELESMEDDRKREDEDQAVERRISEASTDSESPLAAKEDSGTTVPGQVDPAEIQETVEVDLKPTALKITEQELRFLKLLAPMIGTPRAAKRLSNVYRRKPPMTAESVFDDTASRKLEAAYLTPDVVEQRHATLRALGLLPGERVLDVGSGPGLLTADMAQTVGPSGQVIGLDVSDAMLALSQRRCSDLNGAGRVGLVKADATALPFPDATFDAATSIQVYEYVADLPSALAELHRVLRPGGRALILDTDWDSIVWHATDPDRMRRLLAAWTQRFADPHLPRSLTSQLRAAGFKVNQPQVLVLLNSDYRPRHLQHRQRPDHGRLRRYSGQAHPGGGQRLAGRPPPARTPRTVLLQP